MACPATSSTTTSFGSSTPRREAVRVAAGMPAAIAPRARAATGRSPQRERRASATTTAAALPQVPVGPGSNPTPNQVGRSGSRPAPRATGLTSAQAFASGLPLLQNPRRSFLTGTGAPDLVGRVRAAVPILSQSPPICAVLSPRTASGTL